MFFQQFTVEGLGCYSYMLGCPAAGIACVVDPERHIDRYLAVARANKMEITHVFDTHLHADHISGARDLVNATSAIYCIHHSIAADYPHSDLHEGDRFQFGNAQLNVLETPGHTPNSVSFVVSDLSRSTEPMLILSGDLLFVGDIGRPDLAGEDLLLEQVSNLYASLYEKLGQFPDHIELYPAHGKGSLCGKGMSAKPMSTLGFERRQNPLLNKMKYKDFERIMTAEFQVRPPGFISIVEKNRTGPMPIHQRSKLRELTMRDIERIKQNEGIKLIDIRPATEFGAAFIPDSINIGLVSNSAMWLGMTLSAENPLVIVCNDYANALKAEEQFHRVGFDNIIGCISSGVSEYVQNGAELWHLPQLTVSSVQHILSKYPDHTLIDVRTHLEQRADPFADSIHIPFQEFITQGISLPRDTHITIVCGTGYRSNIAGSFLKKHGYHHVFCLMGGTTAWNQATQNR